MERTGVFVSYSHRDRKWLEMLRVHLNFLEKEYDFSIWDDTRLRPGTEWRQEIEQAMASAKVSILLVSAHYLSSDFILREELPPLLLAARKEGARILPLILTHCMFEEVKSLAVFQAFNSPDRPVIELQDGERDALFLKVTQEVRRALLEQVIRPDKNQIDKKSTTEAEKGLRLALAKVSVVGILETAEEGMTIGEVYQKAGMRSRKNIVQSLGEFEQAGLVEKRKIGKRTLWRLSERGKKIGKEMGGTWLFNHDAD